MRGRPLDHAAAVRAADMLRKGLTLIAIGEAMGVNADTITRALRRHIGVKPADLRPEGYAHPTAGSGNTMRLIPRLLELRRSGLGTPEIAKMLSAEEGREVTENALWKALARAGVKLGRERPPPRSPAFVFGSGGLARRRKTAPDKPAVPVGPPPVNCHPLTKADVRADLDSMVAAWHAAGHRIAVCPPTARGEELPHVDTLMHQAGQAASQRQLAAQKRKRAATARRLTGEG